MVFMQDAIVDIGFNGCSLFKMITELQFVALSDAVRSLAQLRYCLYDLYVEGQFLYLEAKSCDNERQKRLFIFDAEGNLL